MGKALTDLEVSECQKLVQYKVRRFFGSRLATHDYEDVCSQAMVEVLAKLSRFDPSRGTIFGYMDQVARSAVLDQMRQQRAEKRRFPGRVDSLNSVLRYGDCECRQQLWQTLDGESVRRHRSVRSAMPSDLDLSVDLEQAASNLNSQERALLELKLAGNSVREIAGKLSVCPGTIYRRLSSLKRKLKTLKPYL